MKYEQISIVINSGVRSRLITDIQHLFHNIQTHAKLHSLKAIEPALDTDSKYCLYQFN